MSAANAVARLLFLAGASYLNIHITLWQPAIAAPLWLVLAYVAVRPMMQRAVDREAELDERSDAAAGRVLGSRTFIDEEHHDRWEALR